MAFEIHVDLTGVTASSASGGMRPENGVYEAEINHADLNTNGNLNLHAKFLTSEYAGYEAYITLGLQFDGEKGPGSKKIVKAALRSIGASEDQLKGLVKMTDKTFLGKRCYVVYARKDGPDGKPNDDKRLITPEDYQKLLQAPKVAAGAVAQSGFQASAPASAPVSVPNGASVPMPTTGGPSLVSL